jgi:hypothetical protein
VRRQARLDLAGRHPGGLGGDDPAVGRDALADDIGGPDLDQPGVAATASSVRCRDGLDLLVERPHRKCAPTLFVVGRHARCVANATRATSPVRGQARAR